MIISAKNLIDAVNIPGRFGSIHIVYNNMYRYTILYYHLERRRLRAINSNVYV